MRYVVLDSNLLIVHYTKTLCLVSKPEATLNGALFDPKEAQSREPTLLLSMDHSQVVILWLKRKWEKEDRELRESQRNT